MKKLMIVVALICATILAGCSKKSSSSEELKTKSPRERSAVKSVEDPTAEIDKLLKEYAAKLRKTGVLSESQISKNVEELRSTVMKQPEEHRLRSLRIAVSSIP